MMRFETTQWPKSRGGIGLKIVDAASSIGGASSSSSCRLQHIQNETKFDSYRKKSKIRNQIRIFCADSALR